MQFVRRYLLLVGVIASLSQRASTTTTATTTTNVASNCSSENLENTVVNEGDTTTFPRLDNGQWLVIPASSFYCSVFGITESDDDDDDDDDDINTQFNSTYALSPTNLTIFKSTLAPEGTMPHSTAGIYILRHVNPNCTRAANLIVIRGGPVCACNATNPNKVTLTCSVFYAESSKQPNNPVFTWVRSDGVQVKQQQPNPRQFERYARQSMSQLSIASNDKTTYECQLTFNRTPMAPFKFMNMQAPTFNVSSSVSCP